jgi:hypothetical protein
VIRAEAPSVIETLAWATVEDLERFLSALLERAPKGSVAAALSVICGT